MAISDDFADATIRHQVYLQRYKSGVVNKILALMKGVESDIVQQVARRDLQSLTRRQVDQLLANLKRKINQGYEPVIDLLNDQVKQLAGYEKRWQMDMFSKTVPIDLDFIAPSDEQIIASVIARPFQGLQLKDWYKGLPDGQFRRLREAIRQGYVDGNTTQQIVQAIRGTRTTSGILSISRRAAETTARTALSHTANVARNQVYRRNRKLIKSVEWVATLDGRTSAICRARDGKVYPTDSGPRPPAHPACRSTTIPVLKSLRELGIKADEVPVKSTRASMNGQVSSELNYGAWLRKQPVSFQNEVLGIKKAQLFRRGDLAMDRFVDKKGNELTLDQLRERESAAWAKAGL